MEGSLFLKSAGIQYGLNEEPLTWQTRKFALSMLPVLKTETVSVDSIKPYMHIDQCTMFQHCKLEWKWNIFFGSFLCSAAKAAKRYSNFCSVPGDIHLFHDFFSSVSSDLLKGNNRSAHVECLSLSAEDKLLHSFVKTSKILLHQNLWDMRRRMVFGMEPES